MNEQKLNKINADKYMEESMYWIARDNDGTLYLWKEKPTRINERGWFNTENGPLGEVGDLFPSDFPEVTWENSPVKCKIIPDNCKMTMEQMDYIGENKFWIARDNDGILNLWKEKPTRITERGWFNTEKGHLGQVGDLNPSDFPEITWENSPVECRIILINPQKQK